MFLDTHVVVWLYEKDLDRFSLRARQLIESSDLLISPIVLLEVECLFETGRISERAGPIFDYLHRVVQLELSGRAFMDVVRTALVTKWTRDPFDRVITATAALDGSPLLTKDDTIHTHYSEAVW